MAPKCASQLPVSAPRPRGRGFILSRTNSSFVVSGALALVRCPAHPSPDQFLKDNFDDRRRGLQAIDPDILSILDGIAAAAYQTFIRCRRLNGANYCADKSISAVSHWSCDTKICSPKTEFLPLTCANRRSTLFGCKVARAIIAPRYRLKFMVCSRRSSALRGIFQGIGFLLLQRLIQIGETCLTTSIGSIARRHLVHRVRCDSQGSDADRRAQRRRNSRGMKTAISRMSALYPMAAIEAWSSVGKCQSAT
jgi:hypothetical protein